MFNNPFDAVTPKKKRYKETSNVNSIIIEAFSAKPVAFNPILGKLVGSACAGLFMSQLLFWWGKGSNKDCVYKSVREFEEETCLTRSEQETSIKKWKKLGVLRVKNKGIPQTRHFYVDEKGLVDLLEKKANEKGIGGYQRVKTNEQESSINKLSLQDLED